jgi:replicative DNA helicase
MPPNSPEAERSVLGCAMLDQDVLDDLALILRPDDFHADSHQRLYRALLAMHTAGKRIDPVLLTTWLKRKGEYEAIGGEPYLCEVVASVPYAIHAIYYAEIVREKAQLRAVIHAATGALQAAYDETIPAAEVLNATEQAVFAVRDRHTSHQVHNIGEVVQDVFAAMDDGDRTPAVATGFTDLDKILRGGLHQGELIILAARPSVGKSAMAGNIADHIAIDLGQPVLFFTLEMSYLAVGERFLCSRAQVDSHRMSGGFMNDGERKALVEASAAMYDKPLYIDDTASRTMAEIAACSRRQSRKEELALVIVDYLQLVTPADARLPREQQVAGLAKGLKHLAREMAVPVLCLAQLNRQAAETSEPKLSQLRESGAVEQDADVVLLLHRDDYGKSTEEAQHDDTAGKAKVIVAKQRNGPTGHIRLVWISNHVRFRSQANHPGDRDNFPR